MQHILIVGRNGVGKSTLIRKLTARIGLPVSGCYSRKEAPSDAGVCPVYIHAIGQPPVYTQENCIGSCQNQKSTAFPAAFERFAPHLEQLPHTGVLVLDELGVMERDALRFQRAVLAILDDPNALVLAAVRDRPSPFLDAVRAHPNCKCYYIDVENRDALFDTICKEQRL